MESGDSKKRSELSQDIEEMMYGFGDMWPPDSEAVDLIDTIVRNYVDDLAQRAMNIAEISGKLDKECFLYLVRKDGPKFNRVRKLLDTYEKIEEIQNAQVIDNDEKI